MFVCIFFHHKGLPLLNETVKCSARVQIGDGLLWKYFWIIEFHPLVECIHKKNLEAANCVKECHLSKINRRRKTEVKDNSYKLSEKPMLKSAKHIFLTSH